LIKTSNRGTPQCNLEASGFTQEILLANSPGRTDQTHQSDQKNQPLQPIKSNQRTGRKEIEKTERAVIEV
jgi:hypothetical protein